MTDEAPALNAEAIIAVLNAHCVDYVVIGAFAARASGAPIPPTLVIVHTSYWVEHLAEAYRPASC